MFPGLGAYALQLTTDTDHDILMTIMERRRLTGGSVGFGRYLAGIYLETSEAEALGNWLLQHVRASRGEEAKK